MREVAGLELPDGAVHARTVDEYHPRERRVVVTPTVGVADRLAVEGQFHVVFLLNAG